MVSMIYKGRSLPLLWVTRKGKKGYFPQDMHIELIKSVQVIIPEDTAVICLGDGEGELALGKVRGKIIHRKNRCDLSLFTLGMRLLKRWLREGKALPPFCLTLSGKALL